MKVILKVLLILIGVISMGLLVFTFGFQFLNSLVVISSAPPADLNDKLIKYIVIMFVACLYLLKDWIRK
ncbi:MAG: hypothetical protein COT85_03480 [Chlamydiae bacterium CG10_big_fil_rev_8_21_14_0_10_42_34]|nr:MAG: hypothetical protein COV82_05970 [Candidatus Peregrinibacteria bacterium CG11_big_fil_rev_8_21_14_0_20_46_8]PIS03099.1 MAG: hypothetical protein COT85_03480 [Chlamydiae bacterium CG10_big_fil_rev_8_21_14_0_10_42_34]